jgi:hypothetical protein
MAVQFPQGFVCALRPTCLTNWRGSYGSASPLAAPAGSSASSPTNKAHSLSIANGLCLTVKELVDTVNTSSGLPWYFCDNISVP